MDKFLVIVLILSLSNETLAWKNWNPINYLKTHEPCGEGKDLARSFLKFLNDTYEDPIDFTLDFLSTCGNTQDRLRCFGIWTALDLHIKKMIQDKDLQPLFDFENELCFIINTQPLAKCDRLINDNYRCQKFLTNFPDTLTTTGFVQKFFSNMMTNTYDEDKLLWLDSFTYYMAKHAEAICSYRCTPN